MNVFMVSAVFYSFIDAWTSELKTKKCESDISQFIANADALVTAQFTEEFLETYLKILEGSPAYFVRRLGSGRMVCGFSELFEKSWKDSAISFEMYLCMYELCYKKMSFITFEKRNPKHLFEYFKKEHERLVYIRPSCSGSERCLGRVEPATLNFCSATLAQEYLFAFKRIYRSITKNPRADIYKLVEELKCLDTEEKRQDWMRKIAGEDNSSWIQKACRSIALMDRFEVVKQLVMLILFHTGDRLPIEDARDRISRLATRTVCYLVEDAREYMEKNGMLNVYEMRALFELKPGEEPSGDGHDGSLFEDPLIAFAERKKNLHLDYEALEALVDWDFRPFITSIVFLMTRKISLNNPVGFAKNNDLVFAYGRVFSIFFPRSYFEETKKIFEKATNPYKHFFTRDFFNRASQSAFKKVNFDLARRYMDYVIIYNVLYFVEALGGVFDEKEFISSASCTIS